MLMCSSSLANEMFVFMITSKLTFFFFRPKVQLPSELESS